METCTSLHQNECDQNAQSSVKKASHQTLAVCMDTLYAPETLVRTFFLRTSTPAFTPQKYNVMARYATLAINQLAACSDHGDVLAAVQSTRHCRFGWRNKCAGCRKLMCTFSKGFEGITSGGMARFCKQNRTKQQQSKPGMHSTLKVHKH